MNLTPHFHQKKKIAFTLSILVLTIALCFWLLSDVVPTKKLNSGSLLTIPRPPSKELNFQRVFRFKEIEFSSKFSSGSLKHVHRKRKNYFAIQVPTDPIALNSTDVKKNWFFFRVSNSGETRKLRVTIDNLQYNWSLWKNGIIPVVRSSINGNKWKLFNRSFSLLMKPKTIQLDLRFKIAKGEQIEFALTFPYTRDRLEHFLSKLQAKLSLKPDLYFARETLILSELGNPIDMIRISAVNDITKFNFPRLKNLFPSRTNSTSNKMFSKNKCNIVISARVHSAETAGSFMLEGLLDYIVDNSSEPLMRTLLEKCVFTVVPMMNPDGVELGLTRTDSKGNNLNAIYQRADMSTPSIYALKKIIRYLEHRNKIRIFLDFHSHMTKRGFFMFGNPLKQSTYNQVLSFPLLLKEIEPRFSLKVSGFGTSKDGFTSRKEISKVTTSIGVYTIEANYWGEAADIKDLKAQQLIQNNLRIIKNSNKFYSLKDFKEFGEAIAKTLGRLIENDSKLEEEKARLNAATTKFYHKYINDPDVETSMNSPNFQ